MESFEYIESGIIFGFQSRDDLKKFRYPIKEWAKHGDTYQFVIKYFDEYGEFAAPEVLVENFPELDISAQSLNLDYAIDVFSNQVLKRNIIAQFTKHKDEVLENPKVALPKLMSGLNEMAVIFDEDVTSYTKGAEERLEAWKQRKIIRGRADGLLGIPTPFKSFNDSGVGWMNGEMISVFARPTIGKTWFCVAVAADAMLAGYKTLIISTEMPKSQIEMRMDVVMANRKGIKLSHNALKTGDDIDEKEYMQFLTDIDAHTMLVCDHIEGEASISLQGIEALIRKHQPDILIIDGLYLVSSGQGKKQMWEQSHSLFYGVKNIAMAHSIPIVVSTQATRDAADVFEPPQANQVAFGDALIRASDIAFSMYAVENSDLERGVQMQKYRDGVQPFETCRMSWDVNYGDIKEKESMF